MTECLDVLRCGVVGGLGNFISEHTWDSIMIHIVTKRAKCTITVLTVRLFKVPIAKTRHFN